MSQTINIFLEGLKQGLFTKRSDGAVIADLTAKGLVG